MPWPDQEDMKNETERVDLRRQPRNFFSSEKWQKIDNT
jgi:hypothetical protein